MGIGVWQVILILVIVLIIFGAGKLPRVMGDVAKGVKNFKAGMQEGVSDKSDTTPPSADAPAQAVETSEKKENAAKS